MAPCTYCKQTVNRDEKNSIACAQCKNIYHNKCCGINDTEAAQIKNKWQCPNCQLNKAVHQYVGVPSGSLQENISAILAHLDKMNDELKEIKSTIEKQADLSFENAERLKSMEERAIRQEETIEKLISENNCLKKNITNLEVRLNQSEQAHLSKALEIRGIPMKTGETPEGIVLSLGVALGIKLKEEDLDQVERRRPKGEDTRPPPILVRFTRQVVRDEVIRMRKIKKDFSTRHLGWDSDEKIYVGEEMTLGNRHLYWLARQKRAAGKVKYVWFARGRVRCRRDDGQPVVIINKAEDLEAFQ